LKEIGVGKTTMLDNIENYIRKTELRILLLSRADRKWTKPDKDGVSILEKFYKDKYTFSFQVYVLLTIIDAVKDIVKTNPACKIIICERSLSASRYVFADMLHAENVFDTTDVDCTKKYPPTTAVQTVYLSCPLDVVRDRIQKRRRSGEEHITMSGKCDRYYDKLITATEIPHIDVSKHITIESVEDGLAGRMD
jgi:deoxyadenosine/deoxycytidine kinase